MVKDLIKEYNQKLYELKELGDKLEEALMEETDNKLGLCNIGAHRTAQLYAQYGITAEDVAKVADDNKLTVTSDDDYQVHYKFTMYGVPCVIVINKCKAGGLSNDDM